MDFRQIHVIFALFMFKRQRNINFKTLHISQCFVFSFLSETTRFETFVNISLGDSTEPPLDLPQISLGDMFSVVGGHCNFTPQLCVPASHQFIDNFAMASSNAG